MSNDDKQRELYEMRANSLRDKISELNAAEEKGEHNKAVKIAKNLLNLGIDKKIIVESTGLSLDEITELDS